ncbi:peptidylprolyl isomerase [Frigoribacterium sp. PhB118]|uniref:peptidylprolyl isomerase n=1 Tax=Frigoribacterium sp. PhB118 TaxID=2485175 RepID=UPI000F492AF3|nr:peptidylprolyl isomerase [Frigoribacterium sp. PhB118]ROS56724.1 peptidyl-prolyl cis-trans isomerase B (cyclophilin B) [Frigoribacterium sp. PhB118]
MAPSKNPDRESRDRLRRYTARQQVHATQVARRRRDNVLAVTAVVVVVGVAAVSQVFWSTSGPGAPAAAPSDAPSASSTPAAGENVGDVPSEAIADGRSWTGGLTLNDGVELGIELDGAKAPQASSVVIDLIQKGFYTGTTCHRMSDAATAKFIQCGSANGDGTGDAGFTFGPLENVPSDGVYPTGTIAMARSTDPYSQSTQFFITYGDTTLDGSTGGYAVVGRVTSGLDQLEAQITDAGLAPGTSETDGAPVVPTTITGATIE